MSTQAEKAEHFLQLHRGTGLLLPNAWDIASARLFEEAGFPAIATTSAGIAFAQGYPDGERISRDEMLEAVGKIATAVKVPVTADVEAGYGAEPETVAETMKRVIEAGAVGANLEDNTGRDNPLYSVEAQVERIRAARAAAAQAGVGLVINARTDTYLHQIGAAETRLEDTLTRARAYLEAGASCVFVPGVIDALTIQELVNGVPGPLNILVGPGAPSAPTLFKLGVKRISVGSSVMQATMGLVKAIAEELRDKGTYEQIGRYQYGYAAAMKLLG
ncbi:MAG: isocitrate lyase/phosphoenolpyruvate mutase family protein [Anaerolineae bacterium]|nr:isocitrate lyase/phosphoenolpyruvate mutase family protein [Anaerolineae bacterium]